MALVLPFGPGGDTDRFGAPPGFGNLACLTYIGYHNLAKIAHAVLQNATSGDPLLAIDWRPYTVWEADNAGDKSFEILLEALPGVHDQTTHPEDFTADYVGVHGYDLKGGQLLIEHWNGSAFVTDLTLTAAELTGGPVMKLFSSAVKSEIWRARITGAQENALLHSEGFDDAYWTKTNLTVTADQTPGPDGETTADQALETAVNAVHQVTRAVDFTSGETYSTSVYLKPINGRTWCYVQLPTTQFGGVVSRAFFNLTGAGAVGTSAGGVTAAITLEPNGFYRCSVAKTATATSNGSVLYGAASADNTDTYLGDITKGLHFWGAQLNTGSALAAYIATTTAAIVEATTLGVIAIGAWLGLPQQEVGWTPPRTARKTVLRTNVSEGGQFLGRSLVRHAWRFEITANFLRVDWAYAAWVAFMRHAERFPFFFMWDIDAASDSAFCWVDGEEIEAPKFSGNFHVDALIAVSAIVGVE